MRTTKPGSIPGSINKNAAKAMSNTGIKHSKSLGDLTNLGTDNSHIKHSKSLGDLANLSMDNSHIKHSKGVGGLTNLGMDNAQIGDLIERTKKTKKKFLSDLKQIKGVGDLPEYLERAFSDWEKGVSDVQSSEGSSDSHKRELEAYLALYETLRAKFNAALCQLQRTSDRSITSTSDRTTCIRNSEATPDSNNSEQEYGLSTVSRDCDSRSNSPHNLLRSLINFLSRICKLLRRAISGKKETMLARDRRDTDNLSDLQADLQDGEQDDFWWDPHSDLNAYLPEELPGVSSDFVRNKDPAYDDAGE